MSRPILNFNARSMPGRWKKAIAAAGRVVAFSPYITNSAATEAMEAKGPACELYTVVTFEVYAAGASRIGCLKRLMAAKVRVYHLETLHAKILLIPRKAVTIGSQNMTVGSSGNQESTVIWLDEKAAVETEKGNPVSGRREIRCQFIILARKDEPTPDYAPDYTRKDELTPDYARRTTREKTN